MCDYLYHALRTPGKSPPHAYARAGGIYHNMIKVGDPTQFTDSAVCMWDKQLSTGFGIALFVSDLHRVRQKIIPVEYCTYLIRLLDKFHSCHGWVLENLHTRNLRLSNIDVFLLDRN